MRRIFTGWMYAASPGLHAVEHPIYDIWLTDCKGPIVTAETKPATAETPPPAPTPPRAQQRPLRRPPQVQQQQPPSGFPLFR
jgi:hypothetical protein